MIIAAVAVLAAAIVPAWAGEGVAIELIDGASVSGTAFRLGDIARYTSGSEELWRALAAEQLGYAPLPGESISLVVDTLLGRLAERGYDWRAIAITGPAVLTIYGAQQDVTSASITDVLAARVAEELGVSAVFNASRALPPVSLPDGDTEITVRFPAKPGWWLPDAVEFRVNGLLSQTLLLSQYGSFSLPVLVAPNGIPGRTLISGAYLGTEQRELQARQRGHHPARAGAGDVDARVDRGGGAGAGLAPAGGLRCRARQRGDAGDPQRRGGAKRAGGGAQRRLSRPDAGCPAC